MLGVYILECIVSNEGFHKLLCIYCRISLFLDALISTPSNFNGSKDVHIEHL